MILNYIIWDPSPEIFSIGSFSIRWYGLLFASGFVFGYIIFQKIFKKEGVPIEELDKFTIYVALGTVIGARLGHVCFYEPGYYCSHPSEILKVWHGGLASHGAALGILTAIWLFVRKSSKNLMWLLDRITIVVALGGSFIRLGNLMNSEIVGSPSKLPWAFAFVRDNIERGLPENFTRHPSQLYESIFYFLLFILLYILYKKGWGKKSGYLFSWFLILLFGFRFIIEFFKDVQVNFEHSMAIDMGQWLSIPFIIGGIVLLIFSIKKHKTSEPNL